MNYQRIYDQLIERSRTRIPPQGYIEHHHIIPRCMNGSDEKENIAILTPEEHFVAHVLLVKIHPEHPGLITAVARMCKGKGRKRRKLYGWLKRKHSEYMKKCQLGKGNSQYGTRWQWIHQGKKLQKIPLKNNIPEGWEKGWFITRVGKKISKPKNKVKVLKLCKVCSMPTELKYAQYCNICRPKSTTKFMNTGPKPFVGARLQNTTFYTNGTKDIRLKEGIVPPYGFRKGRSNGLQYCKRELKVDGSTIGL